MTSAESRQLTFVFADSPSGSKDDPSVDVSTGRSYLLHQAEVKEANDSVARTAGLEAAHVVPGDINLKSRMCGPQVRFCERPGGAIPRA